MDPAQPRDIQAPWAARQSAGDSPGPLPRPLSTVSTRAAREEARRSLRIGLAVGAVVAILVGWSAWAVASKAFGGGHSAYPAEVRTEFLAGCEGGGGDAATCGCILNWFESHKSLGEFVTFLAKVREGEGMTWDVYAGLNSCDKHPSL